MEHWKYDAHSQSHAIKKKKKERQRERERDINKQYRLQLRNSRVHNTNHIEKLLIVNQNEYKTNECSLLLL